MLFGVFPCNRSTTYPTVHHPPPTEGVSSQAVNRADCCKCPASASASSCLEFPTRSSQLRSVLSTPRRQGRSAPINASSFGKAEKREKRRKLSDSDSELDLDSDKACQPSQSPSIVSTTDGMCVCVWRSQVSFVLMAARMRVDSVSLQQDGSIYWLLVDHILLRGKCLSFKQILLPIIQQKASVVSTNPSCNVQKVC